MANAPTNHDHDRIADAIPAIVAAHRRGWRPGRTFTNLELARLIPVLWTADGQPVEPATPV